MDSDTAIIFSGRTMQDTSSPGLGTRVPKAVSLSKPWMPMSLPLRSWKI